MRSLGAVLVVFLLNDTSTHAANKPGMFTSYGVRSCSSALSTHAQMKAISKDKHSDLDVRKIGGPPEAWFLRGWILGFATAINSSINGPPNFFKGMSSLDMVNWVLSWCRNNPDATVDTAVRKLATQPKP